MTKHSIDKPSSNIQPIAASEGHFRALVKASNSDGCRVILNQQ